MRTETFDRIVELKKRLEELKEARISMGERPDRRLSFIYKATVHGFDDYSAVHIRNFSCIDDILKRHEEQIKEEVRAEIQKIYKEIEKL